MHVNNIPRVALFQHPPSEITYQNVYIAGKYIRFFIGIEQNTWYKEGDGVEFSIFMSNRASEERKKIFSMYIDPRNSTDARKWHEIKIDISEYSGKTADIILSTQPGPYNDERWDHAGWAEIEFSY